MKFMTIYRWTEKTARAALKRWLTMFDGTAPQAVQDGLKKLKVLNICTAMQDRMTFQLWETTDQDIADVWPVAMYLQEVFTMETHVVCEGDEFNKAWDKLELLDKVAAPQW